MTPTWTTTSEPWHHWYVLEDTGEADDAMLFGGWTAEQEIGREVGESAYPLGRVWTSALPTQHYW